MNKYNETIKLLNSGKKVFFHYDLMCVAEIERVTLKGRLSCTDMFNKRFFMTETEFNKYNEGCLFEDVIKCKGDC